MDYIGGVLILLVGVSVMWGFLRLKERIDLLEHEVRWLRSELEELKPREVRSANDPKP
jgi:hypothetical protein